MTSLLVLQKQQEALNTAIERKQTQAEELQRKINKKQKEIARLENRLTAILGGEAGKIPVNGKSNGGRKVRRSRDVNQKQLIIDILQKAGKPLTMTQILEAMDTRGYVWESSSPRKALGVALYPDKKNFKKVKSGTFALAK